MRIMQIGEYLKNRRRDLNLTQAQVCAGIWEVSTLSRIERGLQTPGYGLLSTLLERLGMPAARYYALLSQNELDVETLMREIRADEIRFRRAPAEDRPRIRKRAEEKLSRLERLTEPEDQITRQYILSARAALGRKDGPYSFEERLDMLMEAIRLTVPRFDLEKVGHFRYSMAEATLIYQIARTFSQAGKKSQAISIYRQLLDYIRKNNQKLSRYAGQFCLAAHNCAIDLASEKYYPEATALTKKGQKICIEYGDYQFLPGFLSIQAECCYYTGDREKSAALYFQAYYTYAAILDKHNCALIRQEMKEHLGLEPQY